MLRRGGARAEVPNASPGRGLLPFSPPAEHAQGAQGVHPAGTAGTLKLEPVTTGIARVEDPRSVGASPGPQELDGVAKGRVGQRACSLEVIESAQEVVVPARRKDHPGQLRIRDLP